MFDSVLSLCRRNKSKKKKNEFFILCIATSLKTENAACKKLFKELSKWKITGYGTGIKPGLTRVLR